VFLLLYLAITGVVDSYYVDSDSFERAYAVAGSVFVAALEAVMFDTVVSGSLPYSS
jgi:hypothetical protein